MGYRKKVVMANLTKVFSTKSPKEIKALTKAFYMHLADIVVESVKSFTITEKEMRHGITCQNPELINKLYDEGKSVVLLTGHHNSWEWGAMSIPLHFKHQCFGIYKPIKNPKVESLVKSSRQKFGLIMFGMRDTKTYYERYKDQPICVGYVADQTPSNVEAAYWTKFMGIDSAFFRGPEKFAKTYNHAVVYCDIKKVARSRYDVELKLITTEPNNIPEGFIIEEYIRLLEISINREPANWLWSHKRWKHQRPATISN